MCSTFERFLGACGYMPPTTRFAFVSMAVAFVLGSAFMLRN